MRTTGRHPLDPRDGGYSSRKFWFAVGTSVLIFAGGVMAGVWQIFGPHYETTISGLCGVLALYLGGNVSSRYVAGKHAVALAASSDDPPPAPQAEAVNPKEAFLERLQR